jgi:hypothetical protein
VQRAYVSPQRRHPGSRWEASWEITSTEHESFTGTRRDCLAWAQARCANVKLYSRKTHEFEAVE